MCVQDKAEATASTAHLKLIVCLLLNTFLVISCSKKCILLSTLLWLPPYIQVCNPICGQGPELKVPESAYLHWTPQLSDLVKWLLYRNCSFSFWNWSHRELHILFSLARTGFLRFLCLCQGCARYASFPTKGTCVKGMQGVQAFPLLIFLLVCYAFVFPPLEENIKKEEHLQVFQPNWNIFCIKYVQCSRKYRCYCFNFITQLFFYS